MSKRKRGGPPSRDDEDVDIGPKNMVVLRNVDRTFQMGSREVHALKDVNMTLQVGKMATIQGPSGSGKTTLLNLIGAMDVPTSGTVKVADQALGLLADDSLTSFRKHNVGFVFQFFNLIPSLNAVENVLVPTMFDGDPPLERAMGLLEMVGLSDRWDHRPAQLSGGERQRLAVARALINDPPLVLADEPTGNLDHETGDSILDLFTDLVKEGRTVILVTHDIEVANKCEIVFILRDGAMSERKEESA
jgi:putative ABC transport system ATP-binding protein